MIRLMTALMLAALTLLVGCSETQNEQIAKVREFSVRLCNFLPSVQSVTAILAAANPAVSGTLQIATAICDAVAETPPPPSGTATLKSEGDCPKVNGVCVEGEWMEPGSDKKKDEK